MSFPTDPRAHARVRGRPRADVGAMTAAMRAATPPSETRALRVAVVVEGRIVEERLVRRREPVAMGGARFEIDRGAFVLCVPSGATGHLVSRAGKIDLGPHPQRVVLDDSSRGRLAVGRATILFSNQFVIPASLQGALVPRRPGSDRRGFCSRGTH